MTIDVRIPLSQVLTEPSLIAFSKDVGVDRADLFLVDPTLTDFLAFSRNPQLINDPATVMRAVIRTNDRKQVVKAQKVAEAPGNVYAEAFLVATKHIQDFREAQDERGKKIGLWTDDEDELREKLKGTANQTQTEPSEENNS